MKKTDGTEITSSNNNNNNTNGVEKTIGANTLKENVNNNGSKPTVPAHVSFQLLNSRKMKSVLKTRIQSPKSHPSGSSTSKKLKSSSQKPDIVGFSSLTLLNQTSKKQQRINKLLKYSAAPKISVTKRLCQMQKCIQELKTSNKELKYENEYFRKAALRSMTNFVCAKDLNEDLQASVTKCKELEAQLSKKNEIIEKYQLLLKEISSNVNILMKDLENESKNDTGVHEQLKKLSQLQQKSERIVNTTRNASNEKQPNENNNTLSSSSDTLIDADLSFESSSSQSNSQEPRVFDFQFKPIRPTQYKVPSTVSSFDASLSMENNCMSNQDEDDDSIALPLDDMSITTISTASSNSTTTHSQTTNEEFQHGLHELDQKIYRAKRLLESIKIK